MKYLIVIVLLLSALVPLVADSPSTRFGIQMSSDEVLGLLLYFPRVEAAVKIQVNIVDYTDPVTGVKSGSGVAYLGAHLGYLFRLADGRTDLGLGFDFRWGFSTGDQEYDFNINTGPRLAVSYRLGDHVMISGILDPFWVSAFDYSGGGSHMHASLPRTAVAATYFF